MRQTLHDWSVNLVLKALLGTAMLLPYPQRVWFIGMLTRRVVAPIARYHKRSRANLAMIFPQMPPAERQRIAQAAADNAGRTLIEIFSGKRFIEQVKDSPVSGPGIEAIKAARANGQPVILLSGHLGNYDVPRAIFAAQGENVGGLYKPLANAAFNESYVAAITEVNSPVFERGRRGLAQMLSFLKRGGMLGVLFDQRMAQGEPIDFLGKPALTALSAAEMALKYGALLVPVYGIRQPNGISFHFETEEPIPHTDAKTMMQAASDSLATRIRANPEQYFWIHRRWKP